MYHLPACAWRIILILKCLVSMVWLYPPPRIQSSPPGWHCIFRLGDPQAKPSFCHCWWLDSRIDAWAFQRRPWKNMRKVFSKKCYSWWVGGRSKVLFFNHPQTWCWTCLVTGSFILLFHQDPEDGAMAVETSSAPRVDANCGSWPRLVPNKEHMRDLRSC